MDLPSPHSHFDDTFVFQAANGISIKYLPVGPNIFIPPSGCMLSPALSTQLDANRYSDAEVHLAKAFREFESHIQAQLALTPSPIAPPKPTINLAIVNGTSHNSFFGTFMIKFGIKFPNWNRISERTAFLQQYSQCLKERGDGAQLPSSTPSQQQQQQQQHTQQPQQPSAPAQPIRRSTTLAKLPQSALAIKPAPGRFAPIVAPKPQANPMHNILSAMIHVDSPANAVSDGDDDADFNNSDSDFDHGGFAVPCTDDQEAVQEAAQNMSDEELHVDLSFPPLDLFNSITYSTLPTSAHDAYAHEDDTLFMQQDQYPLPYDDSFPALGYDPITNTLLAPIDDVQRDVDAIEAAHAMAFQKEDDIPFAPLSALPSPQPTPNPYDIPSLPHSADYNHRLHQSQPPPYSQQWQQRPHRFPNSPNAPHVPITTLSALPHPLQQLFYDSFGSLPQSSLPPHYLHHPHTASTTSPVPPVSSSPPDPTTLTLTGPMFHQFLQEQNKPRFYHDAMQMRYAAEQLHFGSKYHSNDLSRANSYKVPGVPGLEYQPALCCLENQEQWACLILVSLFRVDNIHQLMLLYDIYHFHATNIISTFKRRFNQHFMAFMSFMDQIDAYFAQALLNNPPSSSSTTTSSTASTSSSTTTSTTDSHSVSDDAIATMFQNISSALNLGPVNTLTPTDLNIVLTMLKNELFFVSLHFIEPFVIKPTPFIKNNRTHTHRSTSFPFLNAIFLWVQAFSLDITITPTSPQPPASPDPALTSASSTTPAEPPTYSQQLFFNVIFPTIQRAILELPLNLYSDCNWGPDPFHVPILNDNLLSTLTQTFTDKDLRLTESKLQTLREAASGIQFGIGIDEALDEYTKLRELEETNNRQLHHVFTIGSEQANRDQWHLYNRSQSHQKSEVTNLLDPNATGKNHLKNIMLGAHNLPLNFTTSSDSEHRTNSNTSTNPPHNNNNRDLSTSSSPSPLRLRNFDLSTNNFLHEVQHLDWSDQYTVEAELGVFMGLGNDVSLLNHLNPTPLPPQPQTPLSNNSTAPYIPHALPIPHTFPALPNSFFPPPPLPTPHTPGQQTETGFFFNGATMKLNLSRKTAIGLMAVSMFGRNGCPIRSLPELNNHFLNPSSTYSRTQDDIIQTTKITKQLEFFTDVAIVNAFSQITNETAFDVTEPTTINYLKSTFLPHLLAQQEENHSWNVQKASGDDFSARTSSQPVTFHSSINIPVYSKLTAMMSYFAFFHPSDDASSPFPNQQPSNHPPCPSNSNLGPSVQSYFEESPIWPPHTSFSNVHGVVELTTSRPILNVDWLLDNLLGRIRIRNDLFSLRMEEIEQVETLVKLLPNRFFTFFARIDAVCGGQDLNATAVPNLNKLLELFQHKWPEKYGKDAIPAPPAAPSLAMSDLDTEGLFDDDAPKSATPLQAIAARNVPQPNHKKDRTPKPNPFTSLCYNEEFYKKVQKEHDLRARELQTQVHPLTPSSFTPKVCAAFRLDDVNKIDQEPSAIYRNLFASLLGRIGQNTFLQNSTAHATQPDAGLISPIMPGLDISQLIPGSISQLYHTLPKLFTVAEYTSGVHDVNFMRYDYPSHDLADFTMLSSKAKLTRTVNKFIQLYNDIEYPDDPEHQIPVIKGPKRDMFSYEPITPSHQDYEVDGAHHTLGKAATDAGSTMQDSPESTTSKSYYTDLYGPAPNHRINLSQYNPHRRWLYGRDAILGMLLILRFSTQRCTATVLGTDGSSMSQSIVDEDIKEETGSDTNSTNFAELNFSSPSSPSDVDPAYAYWKNSQNAGAHGGPIYTNTGDLHFKELVQRFEEFQIVLQANHDYLNDDAVRREFSSLLGDAKFRPLFQTPQISSILQNLSLPSPPTHSPTSPNPSFLPDLSVYLPRLNLIHNPVLHRFMIKQLFFLTKLHRTFNPNVHPEDYSFLHNDPTYCTPSTTVSRNPSARIRRMPSKTQHPPGHLLASAPSNPLPHSHVDRLRDSDSTTDELIAQRLQDDEFDAQDDVNAFQDFQSLHTESPPAYQQHDSQYTDFQTRSDEMIAKELHQQLNYYDSQQDIVTTPHPASTPKSSQRPAPGTPSKTHAKDSSKRDSFDPQEYAEFLGLDKLESGTHSTSSSNAQNISSFNPSDYQDILEDEPQKSTRSHHKRHNPYPPPPTLPQSIYNPPTQPHPSPSEATSTTSHPPSNLRIESIPPSFLSSASIADFANHSIGGGVIGKGSVQEEILFSNSAECLLSLVFLRNIGDTSAARISGVVKHSICDGYSRSLTFAKRLTCFSHDYSTPSSSTNSTPSTTQSRSENASSYPTFSILAVDAIDFSTFASSRDTTTPTYNSTRFLDHVHQTTPHMFLREIIKLTTAFANLRSYQSNSHQVLTQVLKSLTHYPALSSAMATPESSFLIHQHLDHWTDLPFVVAQITNQSLQQTAQWVPIPTHTYLPFHTVHGLLAHTPHLCSLFTTSVSASSTPPTLSGILQQLRPAPLLFEHHHCRLQLPRGIVSSLQTFEPHTRPFFYSPLASMSTNSTPQCSSQPFIAPTSTHLIPNTGRATTWCSGNWGCGAFSANHSVKFFAQLFACSVSDTYLRYHTLSDSKTWGIHEIVLNLWKKQMTISDLLIHVTSNHLVLDASEVQQKSTHMMGTLYNPNNFPRVLAAQSERSFKDQLLSYFARKYPSIDKLCTSSFSYDEQIFPFDPKKEKHEYQNLLEQDRPTFYDDLFARLLKDDPITPLLYSSSSFVVNNNILGYCHQFYQLVPKAVIDIILDVYYAVHADSFTKPSPQVSPTQASITQASNPRFLRTNTFTSIRDHYIAHARAYSASMTLVISDEEQQVDTRLKEAQKTLKTLKKRATDDKKEANSLSHDLSMIRIKNQLLDGFRIIQQSFQPLFQQLESVDKSIETIHENTQEKQKTYVDAQDDLRKTRHVLAQLEQRKLDAEDQLQMSQQEHDSLSLSLVIHREELSQLLLSIEQAEQNRNVLDFDIHLHLAEPGVQVLKRSLPDTPHPAPAPVADDSDSETSGIKRSRTNADLQRSDSANELVQLDDALPAAASPTLAELQERQVGIIEDIAHSEQRCTEMDQTIAKLSAQIPKISAAIQLNRNKIESFQRSQEPDTNHAELYQLLKQRYWLIAALFPFQKRCAEFALLLTPALSLIDLHNTAASNSVKLTQLESQLSSLTKKLKTQPHNPVFIDQVNAKTTELEELEQSLTSDEELVLVETQLQSFHEQQATLFEKFQRQDITFSLAKAQLLATFQQNPLRIIPYLQHVLDLSDYKIPFGPNDLALIDPSDDIDANEQSFLAAGVNPESHLTILAELMKNDQFDPSDAGLLETLREHCTPDFFNRFPLLLTTEEILAFNAAAAATSAALTDIDASHVNVYTIDDDLSSQLLLNLDEFDPFIVRKEARTALGKQASKAELEEEMKTHSYWTLPQQEKLAKQLPYFEQHLQRTLNKATESHQEALELETLLTSKQVKIDDLLAESDELIACDAMVVNYNRRVACLRDILEGLPPILEAYAKHLLLALPNHPPRPLFVPQCFSNPQSLSTYINHKYLLLHTLSTFPQFLTHFFHTIFFTEKSLIVPIRSYTLYNSDWVTNLADLCTKDPPPISAKTYFPLASEDDPPILDFNSFGRELRFLIDSNPNHIPYYHKPPVVPASPRQHTESEAPLFSTLHQSIATCPFPSSILFPTIPHSDSTDDFPDQDEEDPADIAVNALYASLKNSASILKVFK